MTAYRPNRRDELTYRWPRTLSELEDDPYAYSEGSAEPQRLIVEKRDRADSLLVRWGPLAIFAVIVLILMGVI